MYLLPEDRFAETMASYTRHGLAMADTEISDEPDALAAEGGGDDPDACQHDVEDHEGAGDDDGAPGRRTGGWRATWLADVFRAEGLAVVEVAGWKTRGVSFPDSPAEEGVSLFHHTASSARSGPTGGLRVVTHGRAGLPGPIANWLTGRNGVIYVVAAGVANHAGRGNARKAGLPNVTGNSNAFGNEMENDGRGERYSPAQYTAAIKSHAAVHRRMGWPASRGIGHKEWSTSGKPDPTLDMAQVRRDLAVAIARGSTTREDFDDMDQATFNKMMDMWAGTKTAQSLMGQAAKEARFGFDASPDGKGWSLGGAMLTLMKRTGAISGAKTLTDEDTEEPAARESGEGR